MSNLSLADFDAWRRPQSVAVPIVFGIIFLLGVIGNGTLIHIICWNKRMRTSANAYIFNVALGDFIVMVASVPFAATTFTFREWPYEEIICKLSESIQTISVAISAFSLTGLSIERYRAVTSERYARGKRNSFLCSTITFAWIFALLLGIPDAMSAFVKRQEENGITMHFCHAYSPAWGMLYAKISSTVKFGLTYVVPLIFVPFFLCLIGLHLFNQKRLEKGEKKDIEDTTGDTDERPVMEDEKKRRTHPRTMAKIVIALTLSLIVCWLPRHVYNLRHNYWDDDFVHFWRVFEIVGFCLAFLNSCINPVLIYAIDRRFRRHFKRYIFCCCFDDPRQKSHKHRHRHHRKDDRWRKMQGQDAIRRQRGYGRMNGYQSDLEIKRREYEKYRSFDRDRRYSDDERYYNYMRNFNDTPDYDYRRYGTDARIYAKKPFDESNRYRENAERYYGNGPLSMADGSMKRRGIYDTFPKQNYTDRDYADRRIYEDPRQGQALPQYDNKSEYAEIRKVTEPLAREDKEVAEYTSHMTEQKAVESESSTPDKASEMTTPSQERETISKELYL